MSNGTEFTNLESAEDVQALIKDAKRYRWLRKQDWFDAKLCVVVNPKTAVKLGNDCPSNFRLDEMIDKEIMK